jgi:hypothetical protein
MFGYHAVMRFSRPLSSSAARISVISAPTAYECTPVGLHPVYWVTLYLPYLRVLSHSLPIGFQIAIR